MSLIKFYGRKLRIIDEEGAVFVGIASDYIYPEDNDPEEDSIILEDTDGKLVEFFEKDIQKIDILG